MKTKQTKGDRLNWALLKDLKPVELTEELTKGKKLTNKDLEERKKNDSNNKVLVP